MIKALLAASIILLATTTHALANHRRAPTRHFRQTGIASFYDEHNRLTASGEKFNPRDMTAAHRSLPFGTLVRVTRMDTHMFVVVRINDNGPARYLHRTIDLSKHAAEVLGFTHNGLARVRIDIVDLSNE